MLSGAIPEELSKLVNLQELVLYNNQLSGPLPTSLSNMTALTFVAVSGNRLSGAMPASFCQMQAQLSSSGVFGCVLALGGAAETNSFACPLPCTDAAGAAFVKSCGISKCALPPASLSAGGATKRNNLALGLGLGLGGGICLLSLASAAYALRISSKKKAGGDKGLALPASEAAPRLYDVFISYRRKDQRIVEAISDKLKLAGLRVFIDKGGDMSGKPFEAEIYQAMRSSAVVVPIITNEVMRTLSSPETTEDTNKIDFLVVEFLLALHLFSTGGVDRLYPLLVGDDFLNSQAQRLEWDNLMRNATFKQRLAALPDVVPRASLACASAIIASNAGDALNLPPNTTVRDIVSGKTAAPPSDEEHGSAADDERLQARRMHGILSMDAFFLACPQEDLDLYIRGQFVANLRKLGAIAAASGEL